MLGVIEVVVAAVAAVAVYADRAKLKAAFEAKVAGVRSAVKAEVAERIDFAKTEAEKPGAEAKALVAKIEAELHAL